MVGRGVQAGLAAQVQLLGGSAWMLHSGSCLQDTADRFAAKARVFEAAGMELVDAIGLASAGIGWVSQASDAAQYVATFQADQCEVAAAACHRVAVELDAYAAELAHDQSRLRAAVEDLVLAEAALAAALTPAVTPAGLVGTVVGEVATGHVSRARDEVADQVAQVRSLIAVMGERNDDCAQRVGLMVARLAELANPSAGGDWITAGADPGLVAALQGVGVVDTPEQVALLANLRGAQSADEMRDLLAGMDPAMLAGFLERHPDIAVVLAGSMTLAGFTAKQWPPGSAEQRLVAALTGTLNATDRAKAVAAVWNSLPQSERTRLAMLFPTAIGSLGGVAVKDRVAANRVYVVAALEVEQRKWVAAQRAKLGLPPWQAPFDKLMSTEFFRNNITSDPEYDAATFGDRTSPNPFIDEAATRKRIALFQSLLGDSKLTGQPDRQLLVFDPAGDGRIAEVMGNFDTAKNVGVFVPGTTVAADSYAEYANTMATLVRTDESGESAMIVWMGADLPDAIGVDAPDARYADAAAPQLVDFMVGLPIRPRGADGSGVNITLAGHSYGGAVVGTADKLGVPVNNIVHLESAGIGKGVWEVSDYPTTDALGNVRDVQRFTQTTLFDAIHASQGVVNAPSAIVAEVSGVLAMAGSAASGAGQALLGGQLDHQDLITSGLDTLKGSADFGGRVKESVYNATLPAARVVDRHATPGWFAHGGDPDRTPGFINLDPGSYEEGFEEPSKVGDRLNHNWNPITAHTDPVKPFTGTMDNLMAIVRREPVAVR